MSDLLAQVGLSGLLHLAEDHGKDLLGGEALVSLPGAGVDLDVGLGLLLDHLEGVEFDVGLDRLVRPLPADQSLGVEHGVLGVASQLVLGSISDLV